jgi:hypothetical protein
VSEVILHWYKDNGQTKSKQMFRYADHPRQGRSEEDPLKNESNRPLYGFELGQFPLGTKITYWIKAMDTANNSIKSNEKSFMVG